MNDAVRAALPVALPVPLGTPFAGGFYAGRFFIGAHAYEQILAPKDGGELSRMPWNESRANVGDALSYSDGLANTLAMAFAGSELAQKIQELRIGGCDDWHIGSRLQMLIAFGELQKLPDFAPGGPEAFADEWYWTSTQSAPHPDYAWAQDFGYGSQNDCHEGLKFRARAVRRLLIR